MMMNEKQMKEMKAGKSMKQHQMESAKECTPRENSNMTAANKHPGDKHPMSNMPKGGK